MVAEEGVDLGAEAVVASEGADLDPGLKIGGAGPGPSPGLGPGGRTRGAKIGKVGLDLEIPVDPGRDRGPDRGAPGAGVDPVSCFG